MARRKIIPDLNMGMTSLMHACSQCNVEKARELLGQGEDIAVRDKLGRNVVYHAFTDNCNSEMTDGKLI